MSYFSRLTDIVTCNLSQLLEEAQDKVAAIAQIVREMEEGLAGARRSVANATATEERLLAELTDHRRQVAEWTDRAKDHLRAGREPDARHCLVRKREMEDLVAGLEQQHQSAVATREHLSTMQRALEARLADALRKRATLWGEPAPSSIETTHPAVNTRVQEPTRDSQIDAELAALKQQVLGGGRP